MPQAFLKTDEDRLFVARLDIDHAIGHEPGLCEGRGEQILLCDTPEHLATQPRRDSSRKERRGRAVDRAMAAAGHLMQSAKCQSASRQSRSIALMPKGSTDRRRPDAASSRWMRARSSSMAGRVTDVLMALAMDLENSMFHICSHYAKRVNRSLMERRMGRLDL